MTPSAKLDELSATFSKDREFCDALLSSPAAGRVAALLVYYQWARKYFPPGQEALFKEAKRKFHGYSPDEGATWTALLTAGMFKDICLVAYLTIRGLLDEAGTVLRRALESAGILTQLWDDPSKSVFLPNAHSNEFASAFVREPDAGRAQELKRKGISKRFAALDAMAGPATRLYEILSKFSVHGDTPARLTTSGLSPTAWSCGFVNRHLDDPDNQVGPLVAGCEIQCFAIALLCGANGIKETRIGEGAVRLQELIPGVYPNPSVGMQAQVRRVLQELGTRAPERV